MRISSDTKINDFLLQLFLYSLLPSQPDRSDVKDLTEAAFFQNA